MFSLLYLLEFENFLRIYNKNKITTIYLSFKRFNLPKTSNKRYQGISNIGKIMEENIWLDSAHASAELGISEVILSEFRENGLFKPGVHWKSSPYGQDKPWNPEPIYNAQFCKGIIKKSVMNYGLAA